MKIDQDLRWEKNDWHYNKLNFTGNEQKEIMPVFKGVVESRWAPRSSKSVAGRSASRGGFDSHSLPLIIPISIFLI